MGKLLQRNNEDSATISDKLSREVADVEHAIMARKGEVEKLIADMKSANLESLTISPPEETKAFLDGPGAAKPGSTRKMLGKITSKTTSTLVMPCWIVDLS